MAEPKKKTSRGSFVGFLKGDRFRAASATVNLKGSGEAPAPAPYVDPTPASRKHEPSPRPSVAQSEQSDYSQTVSQIAERELALLQQMEDVSALRSRRFAEVPKAAFRGRPSACECDAKRRQTFSPDGARGGEEELLLPSPTARVAPGRVLTGGCSFKAGGVTGAWPPWETHQRPGGS